MAKVRDLTLSQRIIDAFCITYKRPEKVIGKDRIQRDNPVSKEDFALNVIENYIKEVVASAESHVAAENARALAIAKVRSEVSLD